MSRLLIWVLWVLFVTGLLLFAARWWLDHDKTDGPP